MSSIENHVPSLETCKRMKELGWKQGYHNLYVWDRGELCVVQENYDVYHMGSDVIAAPLLSEILEALPAHLVYKEEFDEDGYADDFYQLTMTTDNCSLYLNYITYREGNYHPMGGVCSSKFAEAAALLWVKLREEGILPSNKKE